MYWFFHQQFPIATESLNSLGLKGPSKTKEQLVPTPES